MDQTYSLHCPSSENNLGFKVADGPDHSLSYHIFPPIVAVVLVVNPGGMASHVEEDPLICLSQCGCSRDPAISHLPSWLAVQSWQ